MRDLTDKIIRQSKERERLILMQRTADIDRLKAERGTAEHDLQMHRETCAICKPRTPEEILAFPRCMFGSSYAQIYFKKSRALRGVE